jgi:hypothetical protein
MAKKSRRVKKERQPTRLSPAQMVQPGAGQTANAPSPASAPTRPATKAVDLREEYRYVIADLKRIGIIALAMLAVLVGLALLLT